MSDKINPMPELESMLKKLSLSGMLESLAERNREAIEHQLTYPEFLALLVQDEILRREQKKFQNRLKKAKLRLDKTLERFDFSFNPKINQKLITELSRCEFIPAHVCVLIIGPCGTGKSHLAQALGHCALRKGYDVFSTTQTKLLRQLHKAKATGDYDKQMKRLIKLPLLIIDDFGLKPIQPPYDEDFHELIAERYERAATIVTSNLDFNEWVEAFDNRLLGAASTDRMRHGAYSLIVEGRSFRQAKLTQEGQ